MAVELNQSWMFVAGSVEYLVRGEVRLGASDSSMLQCRIGRLITKYRRSDPYRT